MISEKENTELRILMKMSGEWPGFGGLPLPEMFDTIEALYRVVRAAEKVLPTISQGNFINGVGYELQEALAPFKSAGEPQGEERA